MNAATLAGKIYEMVDSLLDISAEYSEEELVDFRLQIFQTIEDHKEEERCKSLQDT